MQEDFPPELSVVFKSVTSHRQDLSHTPILIFSFAPMSSLEYKKIKIRILKILNRMEKYLMYLKIWLFFDFIKKKKSKICEH